MFSRPTPCAVGRRRQNTGCRLSHHILGEDPHPLQCCQQNKYRAKDPSIRVAEIHGEEDDTGPYKQRRVPETRHAPHMGASPLYRKSHIYAATQDSHQGAWMLNEPCIILRPEQSTTIHGWLNPKRMLTWAMICDNPRITMKLCATCGITQSQLKTLQPDVREWINKKQVSFADVPYMTEWKPTPLHPFDHLNGSVLDVLEHQYPAPVLQKLGITYERLAAMHMTPDMMKCLRYSLEDWKKIGFTTTALKFFTEGEAELVFGAPKDVLHLQLGAL